MKVTKHGSAAAHAAGSAPPRPADAAALRSLQERLAACRQCAEAGYYLGSTPIFSGAAGAVFMTVGQAPGRHEAEVTHRPFSGPAGRRLFRWLAAAGFEESAFRATQAMTAVTKCYPGPHPAGRGDRVPTRAEQSLCAPWLQEELALINPRVLILVGGLAVRRFLGSEPPMTELIGKQFERSGRILVPLPHPSGASQWFNLPENKERLARALDILQALRETGAGVD
jgi:uracil-DNA glycosylase